LSRMTLLMVSMAFKSTTESQWVIHSFTDALNEQSTDGEMFLTRGGGKTYRRGNLNLNESFQEWSYLLRFLQNNTFQVNLSQWPLVQYCYKLWSIYSIDCESWQLQKSYSLLNWFQGSWAPGFSISLMQLDEMGIFFLP
jgi:hypothetical protein